MHNELIGMDFPVEVIQTVLLTGHLDDEIPTSLLIIASPESGKTTATRKANILIKPEAQIEQLAVALTDCTGKGLLKIIKEHPKATHIIFNDLSITAGHKPHVAKYLFSVISAMTEEGVATLADPTGIHPFGEEEGKKGVIGCITPRLVRDQRFVWNVTGLTTRMLPFFYCQGIDTQLKVRRYHAGLLNKSNPGSESTLWVPPQKVHVHLGRYKKDILDLATEVARKLSKEGVSKRNPDYEELGYRRIKQFRALAKANSLLTHPQEKELKVHKVNVEFLRKLSKFVSFTQAEALTESSDSSE